MSVGLPATRPGSRPVEASAIAGAVLGALGFLLFTGMAMAQRPGRPVYAAMPSPAEITAYTAAICSAATCVVNTLYVIWHRFHAAPRPKRRRKPKPDGKPKPADPAPPPG